MDILFDGINFNNLDEYKTPKSKEITDFLSQTKGRLTNNLRKFLGYQQNPNCKINYNGLLTLAQQWEIISEISDNNISDVIYNAPEINIEGLKAEKIYSIPKYNFKYTYR
jgi:hypothetical protein